MRPRSVCEVEMMISGMCHVLSERTLDRLCFFRQVLVKAILYDTDQRNNTNEYDRNIQLDFDHTDH